MIEEIMADSKKTEDEALRGEADAQTAYEDFVKDSNKSITKGMQAIVDMTEDLSKTKEAASMAETDFVNNMKELEGLNAVSGDLHHSCDYILKNFETRQEAR